MEFSFGGLQMPDLDADAELKVTKLVESRLSKIAAFFGAGNLLVLLSVILTIWSQANQQITATGNQLATNIRRDIAGSMIDLDSAVKAANQFIGAIDEKNKRIAELDKKVQTIEKNLTILEDREDLEAATAFLVAWDGQENVTEVFDKIDKKVTTLPEVCGDAKVVAGTLDADKILWEPYRENNTAIFVYIDTSEADFSQTPAYFVSLLGDGGHWSAEGVGAIYSPSPNGFSVYLKWDSNDDLVEYATNRARWYVHWLAVGC